MATTLHFLPEGGTLSSGVRAPTALTQGGLDSYINLDPGAIADDLAYEGTVLPDADTPVWTKSGTGTPSVSGGVLNFIDASAPTESLFYSRTITEPQPATPCIIVARVRINSITRFSPSYEAALLFYIGDSAGIRAAVAFSGETLSIADVIAARSLGGTVGPGLGVWAVVEIRRVNSTTIEAYLDGKVVARWPYSDISSSVGQSVTFGSTGSGIVNADIDYVRAKFTTMLPTTSPTADYVFGPFGSGTVWDMSTIRMLENLFGEAGSVKYKYGAGDTATPTLSGSFQTAAQLTSEADPTGSYLRINVQLTGDGSQDAGWGGMSIDATLAVAAPASAPAGRVTATAATSCAVTVDSLSGTPSTTLRLQTRALGSDDSWTTQASDSTPAVGDVLSASGLTTGTPLEARLIEESAGGAIGDGTHFIVTPASSIWATLLSTVSTILAGQGFTAYEGTAAPPNSTTLAALMWTRPEDVQRRANNMALVAYPVEVELRLRETSDTGELRTQDVATYQRAAISAFDSKDAADYPSIAGLEVVQAEVGTKDEAGRTGDEYDDETRARITIRFLIWESR